MDECIPISLERIERCIAVLDDCCGFTTAQVIREYVGHFCSDRQTPAVYSFNAQFGRLLARNRDRLGIVMVAADERTTDDHDLPTTTARWRCAERIGSVSGASAQTSSSGSDRPGTD
jgi:hypothetical protein